MVDITYKRMPIEDYPRPGSIRDPETIAWMEARSAAFVGMSFRYFSAKAVAERKK
jgi:hypothetical protein